MIPLSLFKIRLANSKFGHPYRIRDNLTFGPSSACESSTVSVHGSLLPSTMACATAKAMATRGLLTSHHCQHVDDETSLGKVNVLLSNPAEST